MKERFLAKIDIKEPDQCWEWLAMRHPDGYGQMKVKEKRKYAHRLSYEIFIGPIPEGMMVCHKCDNPGCVNPHHLFLGTCLDNVRDMISKGRKRQASPDKLSSPGESNPASKLTRVLVDEIRERYAKSNHSQQSLADAYGVSQSTVSNIIRNTNWKK